MVPSARDRQTQRVDVSELFDLAMMACKTLAQDAGRPYEALLPTFLYWPNGDNWRWLEINFIPGEAAGAIQSLARAMRELNVVQFARLPTAQQSARDQLALFATAQDDLSGICVRASCFTRHQLDGKTYAAFDVVVRIDTYLGFVII